jgi:hypothetical protein
MTYPTLSEMRAEDALRALRINKPLDEGALAVVTEQADGADFDESVLPELAAGLYQIVDKLGDPRPQSFGAEFERAAAPLVHRVLKLESMVAGDACFWRWLSFAAGGELGLLVDWRYGSHAQPALSKYFGFGQPKESLYGYLWMRANAVYDDERRDPYELSRAGDVDIWQSHVIRVDFGSVPAVARAFVELVHPSGAPQALSREDYRDLAVEVTRRNASSAFELFDAAAAANFMSQIWKERDGWRTQG